MNHPLQKKRIEKQFKFSYVSKICRKKVKNIKGKSAGHDDIPPGMLKDAAHHLAKPFSTYVDFRNKVEQFYM